MVSGCSRVHIRQKHVYLGVGVVLRLFSLTFLLLNMKWKLQLIIVY